MRTRPSLPAVAAALALAGVAHAQTPVWRAAADQVSAGELRATITRLVAFGTRHTLSDTSSPTRGIGAARRWVASRFGEIGRENGGRLQVLTPSEHMTGDRLPAAGADIQDVLAVLPGTTDPGRVVVISGHIDSRVTDVMNATADAPGANDDGSGVAAVMEAARVLAGHRFAATIVFAVLSGEEQGLYGGRVLAAYARAHGWRVEAALNNDIVGNTTGLNGRHADGYIRLFAAPEEPGAPAGELGLAQFIADRGGRDGALPVQWIDREDRYGRGGDQTPMLRAGFPAIRFSEAAEDWDRQHQDLRPGFGDVISGVDFAYLRRVAALNVRLLAELAAAPAPPADVRIKGALADDTTVTWSPSPGAAGYLVAWRPTLDGASASLAGGAGERRAPADATSAVLKDVVIDDWRFAVAAVGADGARSPLAYPVARAAPHAALAPADAAAIGAVLDHSAAAWSAGDLEGFLRSYARSPETTMVGAHGLIRGWDALAAHYRERYGAGGPALGRLTFTDLELRALGADHALAYGRFHLLRPGHAEETGAFDLVLHKDADGWRIISDHTS